jgi:hypothetical protein
MTRKRRILLYVCLLLVAVGGILVSDSASDLLSEAELALRDWYVIAASRIEVGDKRGVVIEKLSDAWYHCADDHSQASVVTLRGYTDLFFFGPEDFDRATVVIVSSEIIEGEAVVSSIGSFENYTWCVTLPCLPPQFVDRCEDRES